MWYRVYRVDNGEVIEMTSTVRGGLWTKRQAEKKVAIWREGGHECWCEAAC